MRTPSLLLWVAMFLVLQTCYFFVVVVRSDLDSVPRI